jgi:hypothetical protein
MLTTRKNAETKALQAVMAKEKKHSASVLYEWEMACNTNVNRGNVYSQEYIHEHYERGNYNRYNDKAHGATKLVHLENPETGIEFKYIVVKRHMKNGYLPELRNKKATGNQLIDEINCWVEFAETETADLLCPILKYFTSKSDKVTAKSETMQHNVVIIAQKAIYIDNAKWACRKAQELNEANGLHGENAETRYAKLEALSIKQNWRDVMYNGGNSGVIFDYAKGCYKAVFIDYAL